MILLEASCISSNCGNSSEVIYTILQVLIASFLAITFLQSGLDKVTDRKGNMEFLVKHFGNSPLKSATPLLLFIITLMELAAGLSSAVGIVVLLLRDCDYWIFWGSLLSAISLLFLFAGQRIAKDYAGAQSLISYFIVALTGLYLCM